MAGLCEGGNEPAGSLKASKGRKRERKNSVPGIELWIVQLRSGNFSCYSAQIARPSEREGRNPLEHRMGSVLERIFSFVILKGEDPNCMQAMTKTDHEKENKDHEKDKDKCHVKDHKNQDHDMDYEKDNKNHDKDHGKDSSTYYYEDYDNDQDEDKDHDKNHDMNHDKRHNKQHNQDQDENHDKNHDIDHDMDHKGHKGFTIRTKTTIRTMTVIRTITKDHENDKKNGEDHYDKQNHDTDHDKDNKDYGKRYDELNEREHDISLKNHDNDQDMTLPACLTESLIQQLPAQKGYLQRGEDVKINNSQNSLIYE
ncbi:hypothetical protein ANN_17489 [Periplaneta americana]|uniref:Uncharacterized protein n=1 Tax=Periplaneta americana TaxID=6978 RepID=A0ABQ8STN1_PERAM|nr:hypothetical protein ANN_17489 [Periplaneta americana]